MKVLVTGGAGYIGSTTAKALEQAGHVPVILDSLLTGPRVFVRDRIFYEGDIADRDLLARVVREHPDNVTAVCIRQLSPSEAVLAGSPLRDRTPSNGTDVPWLHAPDGAALADKLEEAGLLSEVGKPPQQPEVKA